MNDEKFAQLTEIFKNNPEKAGEFACLSPEEASKTFSQYGLFLTQEELMDASRVIQEKMDALRSGELSEADLEDVAGGTPQDVANGLFVAYLILTAAAVLIPW